MKPREKKSLARAVIVVAAVFLLPTLWIWLSSTGGAESGSADAAAAPTAAAPTTMVELPPEPPTEPDGSPPPPSETEAAENKPTPDEGVASEIQEDGTANNAVDAETSETSTPEPTPPPEKPAEPSQPEDVPAPETTDGTEAQTPAVPTPPVARNIANSSGVMPVVKNTGAFAEFQQKYPRAEVLWVRESEIPEGETRGRVFYEAILGPTGEIVWETRENRSAGFSWIADAYDRQGLVRVGDPTQLRLWKSRDQIAASLDLTYDPSRFTFGYYRHTAEMFYLQKVKAAYLEAVRQKHVEFDPTRGDYLEVVWGMEDSQPAVEAVKFQVPGQPPVDLPL